LGRCGNANDKVYTLARGTGESEAQNPPVSLKGLSAGGRGWGGVGRSGGRGRESQEDSVLSLEPDAGLDLGTLRSQHKPKPRVGRLTAPSRGHDTKLSISKYAIREPAKFYVFI